MAFLYKGPVQAEQLLHDVTRLDATASDRHQAAFQFPGTWIESPWPANPAVMIDKFMSFGQPEAAKAYLDTFTAASDHRAQQDLSESYYLVANELRIQKRESEAILAYQRAQTLAPHKSLVRLELGTMLFKHRRYGEAAPHLDEALRADISNDNTRKMLALSYIQTQRHREAVPHLKSLILSNTRDGNTHLWLGHSLKQAGRPEEALQHLRRALQLIPDSELAANELAWILATHHKASIRHPKESLLLAQRALELASKPRPGMLDTLAAAQAANEDFDAAIKTATEALELARESGDSTLASALERRMAIYRQGQPYHENVPSEP